MDAQDVLKLIKSRAQTLQLVDPRTGYVAEDVLELYFHGAMRYLGTRFQLQQLLTMSQDLFRTQSGVESYSLPPNYGLIAPIEPRRSGLVLTDENGNSPTDLWFYDPARFQLLRSGLTPGRPAYFTQAQNLLWLLPVPDQVYVVQAVIRLAQGEPFDVPDAYVLGVQIETLYKYASDKGVLTQTLIDERVDILKPMVNNEHRTRQRFNRERTYKFASRSYRRAWR